MTYRELIDNYKKYVGNEFDIELEGINYIITELCNLSRSELLLSMDKEIDTNKINLDYLIEVLNEYCINHKPCQYLIGYTYFYGLKLMVNENVLIPRFDTEILVEEVINHINNLKVNNKLSDNTLSIVDIGTGSGAIAISIANAIANAKANAIEFVDIDAIDISTKALEVASINAKMNEVDIRFLNNDLLSGINKKYDLIISNPPYIDEDDPNEGVSKIVKENEPSLALYSIEKGLYHYKRILDESVDRLNDNGYIFFEIPDNKCESIINYASLYYNDIKIIYDYHHLRRVLKIGDKK